MFPNTACTFNAPTCSPSSDAVVSGKGGMPLHPALPVFLKLSIVITNQLPFFSLCSRALSLFYGIPHLFFPGFRALECPFNFYASFPYYRQVEPHSFFGKPLLDILSIVTLTPRYPLA